MCMRYLDTVFSWVRSHRALVQTFLALCIIAIPFVFRPYAVTGGSMEPNFHEGQTVIIETLTPHIHITRGEVLVIRNPHDHAVVEIKRVVGLPGEKIEIGDFGVRAIRTDGTSQHFAAGTLIGGEKNGLFTMQLGPEDYLVLGDNRSKSSDSRTFGAVQSADILGRVLTLR